MAKRQAYHHGDLRQACIDKGMQLLLARGKEAVSLREVARRCGVSPRAPYRHFADRLALLAAVAEQGFVQFGAALAKARRSKRASARFSALARAYVEFALERPALMRLMFGDDFADRQRRFAALDRAAHATFDALKEELATVDRRLATINAAIAWSLVHGIAELARNGQLALVLPSQIGLSQVSAAAARALWRGLGAPSGRDTTAR